MKDEEEYILYEQCIVCEYLCPEDEMIYLVADDEYVCDSICESRRSIA